MNKGLSWLLFLFLLGFLPVTASAQCPDQHDRHCWNLQYMLYAAQTDFRQFQPAPELTGLGLFPIYHRRATSTPLPNLDASFGGASVPCQVSAWMNGVAMYLCQGQASSADAKQWYGATTADLQLLQYLWKFTIASRGEDHYVDAGPPGCEVAPLDGPYIADGPYIGQCPLHLETVMQPNGLVRIHLWLTSYTSPFLVARADAPGKSASPYSRAAEAPLSAPLPAASSPAPPPSSSANLPAPGPSAVPAATAPPAPANAASATPAPPVISASSGAASSGVASGCGELCQDLKHVLENRGSAFRELRSASTNTSRSTVAATSAVAASASSPVAFELAGASSCSIKAQPADSGPALRSAQVSQVHLTPKNAARKAAASGTQYVCYWPEDSPSAAEARFQNLSALLAFLMPSTWSAHQESQTDELSGAKIMVWSAHDAADKPAIGLYLSGQSVGLHVAAAY